MEDYFIGSGDDCIGNVIANYFVKTGNRTLAKQIHSNYSNQPFVSENGKTHAGMIPSLVRNLTNNEYCAKLFIDNLFINNLYNLTKNSYSEQETNKLLKIINTDIKNGNIVGCEGATGSYPLGLLLTNLFQHTVLAINENECVDRGIIKPINQYSDWDLGGIFLIEKNPVKK